LLLKSITITGFKSFPDKTKLEFGQGITAVVGPNGSGKSNISDAVRWVLGEQSNKNLRSQKSADVIFNGTATRKPMGYAEVTLTIDNTDRGLNFDDDAVSVTRRYYHSGESDYRLNGAAVRLKNVHELFMDTGLGRDGYSMIGQGKIEEIVSTKSGERRDIFEEASGISRYRYRKTEAERRLAAAEENLIRLRDILGELEQRVGPLAEQSEKAQKYLVLADEKRQLEISLWLHTLDSARETLRDQDYKITLLRSQYEDSEGKTSEADNRLIEIQEQSAAINIKIGELRAGIEAKQAASAESLSRVAVLENTIFHNNENIERIKNDMAATRDKGSGAILEIERIKAETSQKELENAQLDKELLEKTAALQNLYTAGDMHSGEMSDLTARLNDALMLSGDLRVQKVTAQSSLAEIGERAQGMEAALEEGTQRAEALVKEIGLLNEDLARAAGVIHSCGNTLSGYEMRLKARTEKLDVLKTEIDKLTLDRNDTLRRAGTIEEQEKNLSGYAEAVKSVISRGRQGGLKGIHGPVSRLITVPQKYSAAIETALGFSLQHIVVENEQDAKRAIEYLRDNKLGRATFLPISAVKGHTLNERGLDETAGFIGAASDLVKYDAKYTEIIRSLLGRVALADDMDSAIAMSKRFGYRFRIVTLDGQVINAGGSLTGGSLSRSAGLLSRGSEVKRLSEKAAAIATDIAERSARHKVLADEIATAEADILASSSELQTANEDKIRITAVLSNVENQLESTNAAVNAARSEIEGLEARIAALKETASGSDVRLNELAGEISMLEEKISALDQSGKQIIADRTALSDETAALRIAQMAAKKDIDNLNVQMLQLKSAMSEGDSVAGRMQQDIDRVIGEIESLNGQIAAQKQQSEELKSAIETDNASISALSAKRDGLEKAANDLRSDERENSGAREQLNAEIARLTERKASMQTEYDEIISRLYDEYELTRSGAEQYRKPIENVKVSERELTALRNKIRALGNINVGAIEEYKEVGERYEFLKTQVGDVEYSKSELQNLIKDLTAQMTAKFMEKFVAINQNFSEVFTYMFGGGTAGLSLTDDSNVLESGIEIKVQPPGKNVSLIDQLSGGEKALIAASIYFAIMKVNPPPFCVLDEVEAALDEVNVDRFAEYLRSMTGNTQFIIITHRRGTMEEADMLYGVTMQEKGVSKLLQLDVAAMEKLLQQEKE